MSHRGRRAGLGRAGSVALTIGAVAGVLCLAAVLAGAALGVRPLVVTSGSMGPSIPAGSVVVATDAAASDVVTGDVVAVVVDEGRVMHRVVAAQPAGPDTVLTLQGDANATPDAAPYVVRRVDLVRFHVPLLGHAVTWLATPWGLVALGVAAGGLLAFAFRPPAASKGRRRALALVAVPLAGLGVLGAATPAGAWFDDTGSVTSGAIATHTVVPPASASCSAALLTGTVSWPGDARYDYEVVLRRVSSGAVVSTTQVTGATTSVTYSGLASFGLVVGAGTVDFQVEIRSYVAGATTWRSATVRTYTYLRVFAILIGATVSCTT